MKNNYILLLISGVFCNCPLGQTGQEFCLSVLCCYLFSDYLYNNCQEKDFIIANCGFVFCFYQFFKKFLLLFSYNCLSFLPIPPPHPSRTHLPPPPPPSPLILFSVLYTSSCNPLSPLSPPQSPLVIVRLFLTSMCFYQFLFHLFWSC